MTNFDGGFSGRPVTLRLIVNQDSQNIAGNYSTLGFKLEAIKTGNTTAWNSDPSYWKIQVNGSEWTGSWTYNFNGGIGQTITVRDWINLNVGHNSDGTKTVSVYADASDPSGYLGFASCGGSMGLTTIPRATTATYTNPMVAGSTYTVSLPRASSSFVHIVDLYFGTIQGQRLATNATTSFSYTPPLTLLNEMPTTATGTGFMRVHTYSGVGGSLIGWKDQSLSISAPSTVVPDFTTVTHSEATAGVAANVGKYVQGISKLNLAITGAAGVYNSTITGYKMEIAGQTVNTQSGVTAAPISVSGASVPIVGTVTDSRGRTKSKTVNIEVLAYAPPVVNSISVGRALSSGVLSDEGTYLRVDLNAAVQSLMNTTQRNNMVVRTSTRLRGTTTWTVAETYSVGAVTFNSYRNVGTFSIEQAYDVLVEVIDDFSTSAVQVSIPTAAIFMHWDGKDGVGIGKYRTNGMLDVLGQAYQNDGARVVDDVMFKKARLDPAYSDEVGGPAKLDFLDGNGVSSTAYDWETPYIPWNSRIVHVAPRGGSLKIVSQGSERVPLTLNSNWITYNERNTTGEFRHARVDKLSSGIVVLGGLIAAKTAPAADSVIATLPAGSRPDYRTYFGINHADVAKCIYIEPTGEIKCSSSGWTANYLSLDGIAFPAAGVATWTNVGAVGSGSAFQNGWVDFGSAALGVPRFWKDPFGFVWLQGLVKNGTTADNTPIFTLPTTHQSYAQHHMVTASAETYGMVGTTADNTAVACKANNSATWINLTGAIITTSEARSNNPWQDVTQYANSWGKHGSFTQPSFLRRADGLCMAMGLISAGTLGTPSMAMPAELWPDKHILMAAGANSARARIDLSASTTTSGLFYPMQGSNAWFSLDSKVWLAGR